MEVKDLTADFTEALKKKWILYKISWEAFCSPAGRLQDIAVKGWPSCRNLVCWLSQSQRLFPSPLPSSFLPELLASKDVGFAGCLGTPCIMGSLVESIWKALQEVPVQPPASHMASHELRFSFSGLYLDCWISAWIILGVLLSWTVLWLVLSGSLVGQSQSWLVVKCTIFQIAQVGEAVLLNQVSCSFFPTGAVLYFPSSSFPL